MEERTFPEVYKIRNDARMRRYFSSGCDERIYLDGDGVTRYGVNPYDFRDLIHRGSCTCGTLNPENLEMIDRLLDRNLEATSPYTELLEAQTAQLKSLINFDGEDKFEVFYAPSGSDLVYLPILFSQILHPGKPILNLLSCPEELGSGTLLAVQGKFHAAFNQFDDAVPKGEKIDPSLDIEVVSLKARGTDGRIVNHEEHIKNQIAAHPDHSIIMSLVYGSKSGIEDNLDIIGRVDRPDILWTVDMCQFRHSRKIIHRLLDQNGFVMITGSKFYQAPPFCGALLVGKAFMDRLRAGDLSNFSRLHRLFSAFDFPASIRSETGLALRTNVGLRLRWACSLAEIARFRAIPANVARNKIREWNDFMTDAMRNRPAFELMPDQRVTNKTIISFRIRKDGQFLDHQQLKELYRRVVRDGRLSGTPGQRIFIGQPVAYGDKSFLRVAIGSMCIREFLERDQTRFTDDEAILEVIVQMLDTLETT